MCNKNRIKIKIPIQSFSSIITNSSSEIFCKVHGEDLGEIEYALNSIFNDCDTEADIRDYEYNEDYKEIKCKPYVQFDLGYHVPLDHDIVKVVIEHVLDKKIGKGNYTIEY